MCQLTDKSSVLLLTQNHEPYGSILSSYGSNACNFGYAPESGQMEPAYKACARYLNTGIGRFLTRDTWGGDYNRPLSLNKWMYVEGNPVNYSDPMGLHINERENQYITMDYWRFDRALNYMHGEMVKNANGRDADLMRVWFNSNETCIDPSTGNSVGLFIFSNLRFAILSTPGGEWDHKPILKQMLGANDEFGTYFPIRGDDEFEYYYDIWSNIHYGYVGSSIGFSQNTLQTGANLEHHAPQYLKWLAKIISGGYDTGDVISVDIGVELWEQKRFTLTKEDLRSAIIDHKNDYFVSQDVNGNGLIDRDEIGTEKGKLLPPSGIWFDGK